MSGIGDQIGFDRANADPDRNREAKAVSKSESGSTFRFLTSEKIYAGCDKR